MEECIDDHPDWNDEENSEDDTDFRHVVFCWNLPDKTQTARRELRGRRDVILFP